MRQFKWPRPRKGQGSRGITIIELVVSLSVMIIIILAGTELLQTTVKIEKDVIESMGSTSTEIIVTNRLYQDFKYSGMSYNF
ncbi:MAG: hypothetical protein J6Y94_08420, partial [Bacteriovoracaceae bacterium]|nr:hypothetical protein [Bacteriovoracaceae bacterium]